MLFTNLELMSNGEDFLADPSLTGNGGCLIGLNLGAGGGIKELAEAAVSIEAMDESPAINSFMVC